MSRITFGAACVIVNSVDAARRRLEVETPDLFIAGLDAPDGDPLDLLRTAAAGPASAAATLVVTRRIEAWPGLALRTLAVRGAVDSGHDDPAAISEAVRAVITGRRHWSPAWQRFFAADGPALRHVRQLGPTERLVLALVGSGYEPKAIAALLNLKLRSITAAVERLHGKLGVHHIAALAAMAARLGFVHHTPGGPIRAGFTLLLADYHARGQRPRPPTAELLALYPEAAAFAAARAHLGARLRPGP